jgi:malonyl-CoA O-methyltransferase
MYTIKETIDHYPKVIVDLGSGTGTLSGEISFLFPRSTILCVDIAFRMLQHAKNNNFRDNIKWITADADQLPFPDESCDLIFSNLMLQWSSCFRETLQEIKRVLKPNGLFIFSSLGPKTLYELRHCWKQLDSYQHVLYFPNLKKIYKDIRAVQYNNFSIKVKNYTYFIYEAINLMKELKMLGARNVYGNRQMGLYTKQRLQTVLSEYEKFRNSKGQLPVSYETYFVVLRTPHS